MSRSRNEALAAGISVRATKHNKMRRSLCHDYHVKGTYLLTLTVAGREALLGRLVSQAEAGDAGTLPKVTAAVVLTPLGQQIRDHEIQNISAHYPMVEVWKLCIMPDHIHMIVRVREDLPQGVHLGFIVRGFKAGCSQA